MNEGYRLTDFSLEELSLLVESLEMRIAASKGLSFKDMVTRSTLIEMKVRVLTAFGIVSEREKVNAN